MAKHSFTLPFLPGRQFVAPALVGVITGFEFQADRRTHQLQCFSKIITQITLVSLRQARRLITVNHNYRRILPTLMGITQLDSAPPNQGRLMFIDRLLEQPGQLGRADFADSSPVGCLYSIEQIANTTTV